MTTTATTPVAASSFADVAMHHATRAKAEKLVQMLAAEYPALVLEAVADDAEKLASWVVTLKGDDEILATEDKQVPELVDILDACADLGIDPDDFAPTEDEEDRPSGSVVRETYRAKYREVSTTGQSCGDWLAEILTNLTTTATAGRKGFTVILEKLDAVFQNNGMDLTEKWATNRSNGWVGRYRMNGRQRLERIVLRNKGLYGADVVDGSVEFFKAPDDFLADMAARHEKAIAKEARAEEAAAKAIAAQEQKPDEA